MNPSLIVIGLVLGCCVSAVVGQVNCTGYPDGGYGYGCRAYTNCTGGVGSPADCEWPRQAFDYRIGQCVNRNAAPYPCGEMFNCVGKGYRKFAAPLDCSYFYTCYDNKDHGASPCNSPPTNKILVFDELIQNCNWPRDVPKPCGTKN